MRKIVAELVEAVIVGVLMGILVNVLGIELDIWQFMAIAGGAVISVGIGGWVRKAITTGEYFYNYEWSYLYGEHTILVKASKAEELYINDKLVDRKTGVSFSKIELKGMLDTGETITAIISGEKIKKAVSSDRYLRCELRVNEKSLQSGVV